MPTRKPLAGRNAIVTGAGRGIGLAIAERLAGEGAVVVMADIDRTAAASEALRIGGKGHAVVPAEVDIADRDSVARLADLARTRLGTLHILVNNVVLC